MKDIIKMNLVSYKLQCTSVFLLCFISFFFGVHSDCGPPPSIPNTKEVQETSGTPGQNIVYTCDRDSGYYEIPNRSRTITCQDEGTWTNLAEFCTRACGVPEQLDFAVPIGGALDLDIFYPGQNVSYECRRGYKRVFGLKPLITCLNNYTWSNAGNFCELRSCGNPGEPDNGYIDHTTFTFGSRITYYCNEGYSMKSSRNYRDCQADGKWSNAVPICEVVVCAAPRKPTNGTYDPEKDEYTYMDSVTFSCLEALELVGTSSIACTEKGEWSESIPTCVAVNCKDPVVTNSKRQSGFVGPYRLNSAITFECMPGYFLNGSHSVKCNISSQWEPAVPKCLTVCSDPPKISYALPEERFSKLKHYFDGLTVTYKCKPGFKRNDDEENSLTCLNKVWTSYQPFCSRISCGQPGTVLNGNVSYTDTLFGSKANYICYEGFALNSSVSFRECQANGTWSDLDLVCTAICNSPPRLDFALLDETFANLQRYFSGTFVRYNCKPGYKLNSGKNNTITCMGHKWLEPDDFCTRISCGHPGNLTNGNLSFTDYLYGSNVTYTCKKGYVTNTSRNYRECQADGTWTMAIACTVSCHDPVVLNAKITQVKPKTTSKRPFTQEDVVEIKCEDVYVLKPNGTNVVKSNYVKCNREGQWEPPLPECIPKHGHNVGMIIGIGFGVLFVVGASIFFFYKCLKRQKKRGKPQPDNLNVQYSHCNT